MRSELKEVVHYSLVIGDETISLNEFLGKKISLKYEGEINCVHCGKKTNKSFGGGYCYHHFSTLPECDMCIVKPELCHYHLGTCRGPQWGEEHCMRPHLIYLANSSGAKIGITREPQIPTRWIDQGASYALPIMRVSKRLHSGLLEVLFAKEVADKTNWRKMLKNEIPEIDLKELRDHLFDIFEPEIDRLVSDRFDGSDVEFLEEEVVKIDYPVNEYPEKVKSLSFDKQDLVEGKLMGIKGQYLILDTGVINIRKFSGYKVSFISGEES